LHGDAVGELGVAAAEVLLLDPPDLGCDLLQGYLFAKPGRPFPAVNL